MKLSGALAILLFTLCTVEPAPYLPKSRGHVSHDTGVSNGKRKVSVTRHIVSFDNGRPGHRSFTGFRPTLHIRKFPSNRQSIIHKIVRHGGSSSHGQPRFKGNTFPFNVFSSRGSNRHTGSSTRCYNCRSGGYNRQSGHIPSFNSGQRRDSSFSGNRRGNVQTKYFNVHINRDESPKHDIFNNPGRKIPNQPSGNIPHTFIGTSGPVINIDNSQDAVNGHLPGSKQDKIHSFPETKTHEIISHEVFGDDTTGLETNLNVPLFEDSHTSAEQTVGIISTSDITEKERFGQGVIGFEHYLGYDDKIDNIFLSPFPRETVNQRFFDEETGLEVTHNLENNQFSVPQEPNFHDGNTNSNTHQHGGEVFETHIAQKLPHKRGSSSHVVIDRENIDNLADVNSSYLPPNQESSGTDISIHTGNPPSTHDVLGNDFKQQTTNHDFVSHVVKPDHKLNTQSHSHSSTAFEPTHDRDSSGHVTNNKENKDPIEDFISSYIPPNHVPSRTDITEQDGSSLVENVPDVEDEIKQQKTDHGFEPHVVQPSHDFNTQSHSHISTDIKPIHKHGSSGHVMDNGENIDNIEDVVSSYIPPNQVSSKIDITEQAGSSLLENVPDVIGDKIKQQTTDNNFGPHDVQPGHNFNTQSHSSSNIKPTHDHGSSGHVTENSENIDNIADVISSYIPPNEASSGADLNKHVGLPLPSIHDLVEDEIKEQTTDHGFGSHDVQPGHDFNTQSHSHISTDIKPTHDHGSSGHVTDNRENIGNIDDVISSYLPPNQAPSGTDINRHVSGSLLPSTHDVIEDEIIRQTTDNGFVSDEIKPDKDFNTQGQSHTSTAFEPTHDHGSSGHVTDIKENTDNVEDVISSYLPPNQVPSEIHITRQSDSSLSPIPSDTGIAETSGGENNNDFVTPQEVVNHDLDNQEGEPSDTYGIHSLTPRIG